MAFYRCASVYVTNNSSADVYTASGGIANFNTQLAMPLLDAQIDVNAVQDLHGQSGAYPPGGGVNKWDGEWELGGIDSNTGEESTSSTMWRSANFIPIFPNTEYYCCSPTGVTNSSIRPRFYDAEKNYIGFEVASGSGAMNKRFTTPSNAYFFRIAPSIENCPNHDISLNYPSTDTAYHPYSNICPINGWDEISVVKCGKNLLDNAYFDNMGSYYVVNSDGSITVLQTDDRGWSSISNAIFMKKGTYTLTKTIQKGLVQIRTSLDNYSVSLISNTKLSNTFTLSDDCFIKVKLDANATGDYPITDNFIIEIGSSSTEHKPYNGNTEVINLGDTYYGGRFIQDKSGKRKFEVTHALYTFTGNESFSAMANNRCYTTDINDIYIPSATNEKTVVSTHYLGASQSSPSNNAVYKTTQNKALVFQDDINGIDAVTFKAFLANQYANNTPVIIDYKITEPYTIDLPDGTPFKSLPGVNNIFADTGDTEVAYTRIGAPPVSLSKGPSNEDSEEEEKIEEPEIKEEEPEIKEEITK